MMSHPHWTEVATGKSCSEKLPKFQRKTPALESHFDKVGTLLKRDSNIGAFLWNLQHF